jgi:hypothetical protein
MRKLNIPEPGRGGCHRAIIARVSQIIFDGAYDLKGADYHHKSRRESKAGEYRKKREVSNTIEFVVIFNFGKNLSKIN